MSIELKISLDQQKGISIEGPIQDKLMCYGLLELAKDALRNYNPKEASPIVVSSQLPGV